MKTHAHVLSMSDRARTFPGRIKGVSMKKERGFTLVEGGGVIVIILSVFGLWGWVWNIVKLIGLIDGPVTAMFIGRIVGIFAAPLGAVLGFF